MHAGPSDQSCQACGNPAIVHVNLAGIENGWKSTICVSSTWMRCLPFFREPGRPE